MLARSHSRWLLPVAILLLVVPSLWLARYLIPDFHTTREMMRPGKLVIGPPIAPSAVPFSIVVAGLYLPGVILLLSALISVRKRQRGMTS